MAIRATERAGEDIPAAYIQQAKEECTLVPRPSAVPEVARFRTTRRLAWEDGGPPSGLPRVWAQGPNIAAVAGRKLPVWAQQAAVEPAAEGARRGAPAVAVRQDGQSAPSSWDSRYTTAVPRLRTLGRSN